MNDHDNHQTMEREIAELSALGRMRKHAADDESTSLRNISHIADNLPTEQLADVNSSDDDETETYDVDEGLAATTSTSSSSSSAPSDVVALPVTTSERAVCEVCLLEPKAPLALVPCGHSRFCRRCADELQRMHLRCPLCRSDITVVMQLY